MSVIALTDPQWGSHRIAQRHTGSHRANRQPGPGPLTDTVMTPSLPTFSMALAMSSPISRSPLAEMVATCRGSSAVDDRHHHAAVC